MLTKNELELVQKELLNWFDKNQRDFPWRQTRDPYKVLIAEKLLQQTIVRQQVVDAYELILSYYPTIYELSNANIEHLEEIIQPLGLKYRAKELIRLADEIIERHDGNIPNDLKSLLLLHGIGDYSARAILSFAYGEEVPIVDTNVARFLHRFFYIHEPIPKNPARSKKLRELFKSLLPKGKSREFNFAVLDFSALICKTGSPVCSECPLKQICMYEEGQL